MEIILISESKLKIMLTPDDMEEYSISEEMLSFEKKDVRIAFAGILDEVRQKTGFDSSSERLFIQVYPSKDGGCEVYLTCSEDGSRQGGKEKDKSRQQKGKKEYCVYAFRNLNDALAACAVLRKSGYSFDSRLYKQNAQNGGYCLVLQEEVLQDGRYKKKHSPSKSDLAAEYGRRMGGKEAMLYISEHASPLIVKDAVRLAGGL